MKGTMALTSLVLLALLAAGNNLIHRGHRNVMMTRSLGHCTEGPCLIFPRSRMRDERRHVFLHPCLAAEENGIRGHVYTEIMNAHYQFHPDFCASALL